LTLCHINHFVDDDNDDDDDDDDDDGDLPRLWHGDASTDGDTAGGPRTRALAAVKRAVDERVDHRVGHAEEEDPQNVAVLDVTHVDERVDDEDDLVRRPADDERGHDDGSHTERFHLGLREQTTAHGRCSSSVARQFNTVR